MNRRFKTTTSRRLLAGAVLCALLMTQALGLLHRVLHARGPAQAQQAQAAQSAQGAAASPYRSLQGLFAQHHDALDCQVFDPLTQADAPGFVITAPPADALAERHQPTWATPDLVAQAAGYLARGPPTRA